LLFYEVKLLFCVNNDEHAFLFSVGIALYFSHERGFMWWPDAVPAVGGAVLCCAVCCAVCCVLCCVLCSITDEDVAASEAEFMSQMNTTLDAAGQRRFAAGCRNFVDTLK
jgi:hypothetical protein